MGETQDDLGYLIGQTSRWLRALLAEELRFHGLDDTDYVVLHFVERAGDRGVGTKALSGRAEIEFDEVKAVARKLIRGGWLTDLPDPGERESRIVTLTPKALSVMPVLADAARWAIERGVNGFTTQEIEALAEYLRRMQTNLRR